MHELALRKPVQNWAWQIAQGVRIRLTTFTVSARKTTRKMKMYRFNTRARISPSSRGMNYDWSCEVSAGLDVKGITNKLSSNATGDA